MHSTFCISMTECNALICLYVLVGLFGSLGYPNFFPSDWLATILEMQSKSGYGCFLEEADGKFVPSSKLSKSEKEHGLTDSGELCSSHFTSVALAALTMYTDYIYDVCNF